MPRKLRIQIDLARLQKNMSKEEGRAVSLDEVRQWLEEAGFSHVDGGWIVDEPDLGQLDPSEVTTVEDVAED